MYNGDFDYANYRLAGTIVRLKGEPVFVHAILPGMVAELSNLNNIYENYRADANELDIVPVPLGMCNYEGDVSYLSRVPLRRDWRQGLRRENFISDNYPHAGIPPQELAKVIRGEYPTYAEALESVKKGAKGVAWCRQWAILKGNVLRYKWDKVGKVKAGQFILLDEYKHLYEALEEAV